MLLYRAEQALQLRPTQGAEVRWLAPHQDLRDTVRFLMDLFVLWEKSPGLCWRLMFRSCLVTVLLRGHNVCLSHICPGLISLFGIQ